MRLKRFASSIGPGIFILGYIIGTGSVTSMASAGASYGLSLLWALALSCLFTYVMTVAISRVTILTGRTLLFAIRERFGLAVAAFIILGLMLTVTTSIIGVMGIVTDVLREWTRPFTPGGTGVHPVLSAVAFTGLLYYLYWVGNQALFLRAMALLVAVMGVCFVATSIIVIPGPGTLLAAMVPAIPEGDGAYLILAGMVGTTMATVCLVTRSYLVAEQGWTLADLKLEQRDSAIALFLTFLVSGAVMAAAAGTMHVKGIRIERAIDMVNTLEPLAGRMAASIFAFGIVAAGLSSLFPNYLLGPWTIFDVANRPRNMKGRWVRLAVLIIAALGLVVPVFGGRPVILMIASQAVSPVVMPLLILLVTLLLHDKRHSHRYQNPTWLTVSLWITFVLSLLLDLTHEN